MSHVNRRVRKGTVISPVNTPQYRKRRNHSLDVTNENISSKTSTKLQISKGKALDRHPTSHFDSDMNGLKTTLYIIPQPLCSFVNLVL